MAKANLELITAIRNAAHNLHISSDYQWGHMGSCNCGYLAQELTRLTKAEIHQRAMQKYGDWNEQLNDYCPKSGLPMDELISCMLDAGLDSTDLKHLERLSDPFVLRSIPFEHRWLIHNKKSDVVFYMNKWADLLEEEIIDCIKLPTTETMVSVEETV